ncbi:hypothetical protein [Chitinophaga rhizophila]|uniref:Uncharacterized protein n=1 Tax=Chitinophaga rhizophila TaxID=2866212 RepID=A0ABS7GAG5_9BACT|nr:hypothetical protein [Chitinophaga rhizophila]MBW8684655.1 hypothetical protein [Chitinophaga rhizophila]
MGVNRRHKRVLAIFMVLLYGFILFPVALWHSHAHQANHAYFKAPGSDKKHVSVSHSCIICEHAYAPYIAQDDNWNSFIPVQYQRYRQPCLTVCYPPSLRYYNTRGSPTA